MHTVNSKPKGDSYSRTLSKWVWKKQWTSLLCCFFCILHTTDNGYIMICIYNLSCFIVFFLCHKHKCGKMSLERYSQMLICDNLLDLLAQLLMRRYGGTTDLPREFPRFVGHFHCILFVCWVLSLHVFWENISSTLELNGSKMFCILTLPIGVFIL